MGVNMDFNGNIPRIEIHYFDRLGRLTDKSNAVTMVVIEYDDANHVIRSFMSAIEQNE